MTDSKRNATAGKVATPKAGAAPQKDVADLGDVLHKAIGARVKLTVAPHGTTYEGTLFAASPELNLLAINTAPAAPSTSTPSLSPAAAATAGDYHVIPVAHLTSFTVLSGGDAEGFEGAQPPIERLDIKALRQREEAAVRKLKEKQAMRGRGVGREAQEIFDALARTLPCRWHETSIIVNEAVVIKPPYRIEDAQAPAGKEQSLPHVKKIMEGYFARKGGNNKPAVVVGSNVNTRPVVATPIPVRKGG